MAHFHHIINPCTDERDSLPEFLLGRITIDPVYTVSPVIAFLGERVGHIIDRVIVCRTYSFVAGTQQDDQKQKKE
jgi:hypothetical protein